MHNNKINNKKYIGITSINPQKRWANGNKHSEYSKNLIRMSKIGRFLSENNHNSKKLINLDTGEVFNCVMDVTRKYGYNNSSISRCCRGEVKISHGYRWKYLNNK